MCIDHQPPQFQSLLAQLLDCGEIKLEPQASGRNSRVYNVACGDSTRYAAKFYFGHRWTERDSLEAEFRGLQFLWDNGVRRIPRPVIAARGVARRRRGEPLRQYEPIKCVA